MFEDRRSRVVRCERSRRARLAGKRLREEGERMGESSSSSTRARGGSNGLAGALWLAKKEIVRAWLSYPLTGLLLLFLGFFVVPSVSGVFEFEGFGAWGRKMEGFYNAFFADYLFLVICAFLAVNEVSGTRTLGRRGTFSSKLPFLRSLPIPAQSLVGSRAASLLFALVLNVSAFFLPAFFLSDLGELGTSYLWFACVWIGYSLLGSGLFLLLELTVNGRVYTLIYFGLAVSLMVVLALLEWTLDLSLVGRTAELAQGYGALAAAFSILAGSAAFALLAWLTVHRIRKRDLSGSLSV